MAKVQVVYTVEYTETMEWPDDEMDGFNHDNLVCNCDPELASISNHNHEIKSVSVNGEDHDF